MELIFNELSLHGQFSTPAEFAHAIARVMGMRNVARGFGRDLYCGYEARNRKVIGEQSLYSTAGHLAKDEQRALMQWLTRHGPFWDDARVHSEDEYLQCRGELVTGGAIAEAAWSIREGNARGVVSIDPSAWLSSPLRVDWMDNGPSASADVPNYWRPDDLERDLTAEPVAFASWDDLAGAARNRFSGLTFSRDAFAPLHGHPFNRSAAERVIERLGVLHELIGYVDEHGRRTPDGHALYENHFAGDNAWFSDSSESEKARFEKNLTFRHPDKVGEYLLCTWHGKVKTLQLRIHFSWPPQRGERLYVVYVGPKITKR